MKASTLGEILQTTYLKPLTDVDFEEYYVPCTEPRGDDPLEKIKELLIAFQGSPQAIKILFSGHRGCGKSTELERLCRDLDDQLFIVKFSVQDELDINNVTYVDLLFEITHQVYKKADESGVSIDPKIIDAVFSWFKKIDVEVIKENYEELSAKASAGGGIKCLVEFMAKVSGIIRNSVETREIIREKIEPKVSELILRCNMVMTEISQRRKQNILIIVEDLDKLSLEISRKMFCDHGSQLTQINSHVIYTVPVALEYSQYAAALSGYFGYRYVLPMIKLKELGEESVGTISPGKKIIRTIVERRLDLSLLEDGILDGLIDITGGSIRDLFRLLQEATLSTIGRVEKIDEQARKLATNKLKAEYKRALTEKREGNLVIKVDDYYDRLNEVVKNKTNPNPNQDQAFMDLLHSTHILMYNGEGWYDLHPLVREILDERNKVIAHL